MKIFESIINHKVNTITERELLKYGKQFQISISKEEAGKIAAILRGKNVNIFNSSERMKIIKEIEKITGAKTAQEINRLFLKFTK